MLQTIAKPSALQRCCRPCVRCLPAVAIWSPSLSVVATVVVAGVINVNSAHYLELPSTESYVHMVQAIRLMDKVKQIFTHKLYLKRLKEV